ncbi:hypothetical protein P5V15_005245 [Pogonomyrmex californicus]
MFIKNVRKHMYNASLLRRSFTHVECNKALQKFKLKQAKMQCADDLPVYLKGGLRDKILFNITLAMLFCNTLQSVYIFKGFFTKY